jgi:diaminopimelate epimerase
VIVRTPAGPLELRWNTELTKDISLVGPAEIVAEGAFYCEKMEENEHRTN